MFAETEMFKTFVVRRLVTKVSGKNYVSIFRAEIWKSKQMFSPRNWYQPFRYGFGWYQPTRLNCYIMLNCERREYRKFCAIRVDVHTWPESINLYLVKTVKLQFTVTHIRCNRLIMQCLTLINVQVIEEAYPTWFGPYRPSPGRLLQGKTFVTLIVRDVQMWR
jgi:hypothetical protein